MARSFQNAVAKHIATRLSAYLGVHTSQVAVETCAKRALQRDAESLTPADVPKMCEMLTPMLQPFIGREWTEIVLASVIREFES